MEIICVREVKILQKRMSSLIPLVQLPTGVNKIYNFSTERRFNRNSYNYNQNSQMLPVILYLAIPSGWTNDKVEMYSERRQKRLKQKQRDHERMKAFNERKSVCSLFPFLHWTIVKLRK